jgi:hypothetical protein
MQDMYPGSMEIRAHVLATAEAKISQFVCDAPSDFAPASPADIYQISWDTYH